MEEVFEFFKKCGTFYIATEEGNQPRVRPFGGKVMDKSVTVVISGSFRKYMNEIRELIIELRKHGVEVLKPDLRETVENKDKPEFVLFEGEEGEHPFKLQSDYYDAVQQCDAHIVFNKNSYFGQSAEMEMASRLHGVTFGTGKNKWKKPIYLLEKPDPDKWIKEASKYGVVDEGKEYDINYFCDFLNGLIENGYLRVGLDTFYHDFGIQNPGLENEEYEDERS